MKLTSTPDNRIFHAALRKITAGNPDLHNAIAFLFSALSLARSGEELSVDADIEHCNLSTVFHLATSGLVAPLLFRRLQQKGVASTLPEDFIAALQAFYDANLERNQHHRHVLLEAGEALNQQNIVPILLKGSHALVGQIPDADTRVLSDIDLLVPAPKTQQAQQILLQAGFFHDEKHLGMNDEPTYHHLAPLYHSSGNGYVELHRFPNATRHQPALIEDCFHPDNLIPINIAGVRFLANKPEQILIYNQIHHYYSALAIDKYDIRHLTEQAMLCHLLGDESIQDIQAYIIAMAPSFIKKSQLQLSLVSVLFEERIPAISDEQQNKVLALILKNPRLMRRNKLTNLLNVLAYAGTKAFDPIWMKNRVINPAWYSTLPKKIHGAIHTRFRFR